MTRDQKRRLASVLISHAADLVEFWDERLVSGYGPSGLSDVRDISAEDAAQQIANWLGKLPGVVWDTRLPYPEE